jgi:putative heme-binding domain-containing protein
MNPAYFPAALVPFMAASALAAPVFEFKDGERVALLGDAFIEREQYEGWIELAATTQFPDRAVTFRNLGWNADTPAGESRNGLSLLQAGLEPPEEGWRQLLRQIETYRPNVIVLGYGMAASLAGGSSPEKFQTDLERLLDEAPGAAGGEIRFLILGPPPRFERVGEDPEALAAHRGALAAIAGVLRQTAAKRGIPFVPLDELPQNPEFSQNGIHLTSEGYRAVARHLEKALGWKPGDWDQGEAAAALRRHVLKKNEWFFHRSRPANMAYIFGFRNKEQGNNAGEILEFDKLVAEYDANIAKMRDLSKNVVVPDAPLRTESAFAAKVPQPNPEFTVAEGYEITLWAENPLLHKPTQMNFDPSGRLWVASSESYPQVEVGQTADDKIIVLSDTNGDGKADSSTVFAGGLLMPTGLLPGDGGVYVAQSTDLLHFKDTTGDGKGDQMTRVLSGFGTEDTHHNLHTLRRGPDGRIWMNQSIYTRTDSETPGGLFRLKSGGIMRFDPRSLDLETVFYGWINSWGHQFDRYGQSFVTDGAGGGGINWGVPGAMYAAYARAPKILGSVSPGGYPKFSGLEIIESPHFPAEWQGNMVACDFRAHRIVRFGISDQDSGYVTQELGDLVRTNSVNFRPIDVKIGPDGALYIADWSNPIINHGEVDFRDPRRDREHGRIWKVSRKQSPLAEKRDFAALGEKELLVALASDYRNDREQATAVLFESRSETLNSTLADWAAKASDEKTLLAALWLSQGRNVPNPGLLDKVLGHEKGEVRAAGVRGLGDWLSEVDDALGRLKKAVSDEHPRVRIEAVRVLAKLPGRESFDVALEALDHPSDRFIEYALWLSVQSHGEEWLAALLEGGSVAAKDAGRLEFVLSNLPPAKAAEATARLLPAPLPRDGSGPWLKLALATGDSAVLAKVLEQVVAGGFEKDPALAALRGIAQAISQRQVDPAADFAKLRPMIEGAESDLRVAAIALAGAGGRPDAMAPLIAIAADGQAAPALRSAAVEALANFPAGPAREALVALGGESSPPVLRQQAALALTRHHRAAAVPILAQVASSLADSDSARSFWQRVLSAKGISAELAVVFKNQPMAPQLAGLTLQNIPDVAEHDELLKTLREQAGSGMAETYTVERIAKMAERAAANGDAARGEMIYRRNSLACVACHALGGAGGKVGPDMTSLGASAPLDYIIESVVLPSAKIKEGYHAVTLETKDGKAIMGQLVRSGAGSSVVRDATGAEVTIPDNMVVKRTDAGSLMPGNLINGLSDQETDDLFKFLSQLGKPGDFDATKSRSPKIWAVVGLRTENQEAASQGDPSLPWLPVVGTVGGKLLAEDANMVSGGELMVGSKLQLAGPAKVSLQFSNGFRPTAVWINGVPAPGGEAELEAGIHKIVFRTPQLTQAVTMKSAVGTFLPEW